MYINFSTLDRFLQIFSFEDFLYLCAVKQQEAEKQEQLKADQEKLKEQKYIKTLKNGTIRLDKKGTEFLNKVSRSDKITEETKILGEWLIKIYKRREDGIVRNKTELFRRLQWFQDETGIIKNKLAKLLQCFISDTYTKETGLTVEEFKRQNPRMVLSNLVENVFWTPKDRYSKYYNLNDSPLYMYYDENQDYVESVWEKLNLND